MVEPVFTDAEWSEWRRSQQAGSSNDQKKNNEEITKRLAKTENTYKFKCEEVEKKIKEMKALYEFGRGSKGRVPGEDGQPE